MNRSPTLEIPEWMFDSGMCSQMKQESLAYVSSAALVTLKHLLSGTPGLIELTVVQAQHLSSSSGDADAHTIPSQSERVVFPTSEASAVAAGGTSEDGPPVGSDAERASAEAVFFQQQATGGGR
ncbi:MAG TPA: hypothetical protein VIX90_08775 [Edaphobacter sp.]